MSGNPGYFPVHRIAQACVSCRRKKCRCTGDRPVCGHCRRLGLECVYPAENTSRNSNEIQLSQDLKSVSPTAASESVVARLVAIEDVLRNLGSQMDRIEGYLARTTQSHISHSIEDFVPGEPSGTLAATTIATEDRDDEFYNEHDPISAENTGVPDEVLLAVVDAFFDYCHNQPYSFFHEEKFRHHLSQQKVPLHLLLAIMAMAVRFSHHPYFVGRIHEASIGFANRAWKSIVSDCFTVGKAAEVSIVQTIALLALFDFTAGKSRHGSAWVKVGMAVRIAQDCGLMLDSAPHLPYAEQEEQRRVFWSVYILDRLVSCGRGRPPAIVDASCLLQLPCSDSVWKDGLWRKTLSLDELSNRTLQAPEPQAAFAKVVVMAHILGRSAQYMLQEFNIRSRHPPWDPSSDFAGIESDLLHLETQLEMQKPVQRMLTPHIAANGTVNHQSTGPILFSRALFHLCYCLLNHPFLLRRRIETCQNPAPASFLTRAFSLGWQHAQQMIELIRDARNQGCVFQASFSGYCAVVAGSIAMLNIHHEDARTRELAEVLLQETVAYLEDVGHCWRNVSSMAQVLEQIARNSSTFRFLCSSKPQIAALSSADADEMWSVVDYSTMSNEGIEVFIRNQQPDASLWDNSWIELFGTANDGYDFGFAL